MNRDKLLLIIIKIILMMIICVYMLVSKLFLDNLLLIHIAFYDLVGAFVSLLC